jgi:hypothetical protein
MGTGGGGVIVTPKTTDPAPETTALEGARCEDCGGRVVELRHCTDGVCFRHLVWCTNAACPKRGVMRSLDVPAAI